MTDDLYGGDGVTVTYIDYLTGESTALADDDIETEGGGPASRQGAPIGGFATHSDGQVIHLKIGGPSWPMKLRNPSSKSYRRGA